VLSITGAAPARSNPHDPCATCHVTETDPALVEPEPALCLRCHPSRDGGSEHPIGIAPGAGGAPILPLRAGRMTCITCHHEHATSGSMMLRLPLWDLCSACHRY
jgi:predicted CXXCH cytochrome family protein